MREASPRRAPLPRECPPTLLLSRQVVFAVVADVSISIINVEAWSVAVADALYAEPRAVAHPPKHALVHFLGPEPTPVARKRLVELENALHREYPMLEGGRTAILTSSSVTRGAITAWRWISGFHTRAYAPGNVAEGASWLLGECGTESTGAVVDTYRSALDMARRDT